MCVVSIQMLLLMLFPLGQAILSEDEGNIQETTIEVLIVVEKNLSEEFKCSIDRHSYFCKLSKEVEEMYETVQGIKLNIVIKGLKIVEKLEDQPFLENHFVTNRHGTFLKASCFDAFKGFAKIQNWTKEYDAVLLLTKTKIIDGRSVIIGMSYLWGLCKEEENIGITLPEAPTIAHELTYMLGIQDDDFYYKYKKTPYHTTCSKKKGYIMGDYSDTKTENSRQFSMCSAHMLRNYLNSDPHPCLMREDANDTVMCKTGRCKDYVCVPPTTT